MMDDMASRIAHIKALLPEFHSTLDVFNKSTSKFHIVRSINPTSIAPRTLYILDSSFNPPSLAHLVLATSAVTRPAQNDASPSRLLLLFSTHNADKAPSPASFAQRIALMTIFAEDLAQILSERQDPGHADVSNLSIDIGLTKEPYYTDKSSAITHTCPPSYPSNPTHVHLVGFDTLTRFCNPKYYEKHRPPLAALTPFFAAGHKLRVTQRPSDTDDQSSRAFGTAGEQERYLQRLRDGELEKEGFEKAWGERIDMVPATEGVGVSSTRVRRASKDADWALVSRLCTPGVAAWVRSQGLYREDDSGRKMME